MDQKRPYEKVMEKFGGPQKTKELLNERGYDIGISTIWKWGQPKDKQGTNGNIPHRWHKPLAETAWTHGIPLSAADLVDI